MANTIAVSVIGDVKDINKKLGNVEKQLSGFGKSIGKVGSLLKGAFAFAAADAVVGQIKGAVNAASDMNETLSKSQTIFGSASKDIEAFGNNAAKSLGLSKQEAIAGAASFGNFFDQIGIGKKASADMSKSFLQMSADLASFNNADPSKVMESFISATRGEYDSLQQFIPTVNAAKVETEALRLSHKKSAKDLTDADKAQALYSLSVKGMGKAQGDFARTSTGAANQQRILTAQWKNAQATIGQALLPILTKLLNFITSTAIPAIGKFADYFSRNLLPTLKEVGTVLGTVGTFIGQHITLFTTLGVIIGTVAAATKLYTIAIAAQNAIMAAGGIAKYLASLNVVKVATAAWTAVQWLLNVALTANPIGIVIVAIAALIAIIVVLWKKNDGFRKALIAAWNAIKSATVSVWNAVKSAVVTAWNAIKSAISTSINAVKGAISKGLGAIKSAWIAAWNGIKGFLDTAWNKIKSAVSAAINGVASLMKGIRNKITGAVGDLGGLLKNAGKKIIQGLIDGISGMIGSLKNKLSSVTNLIPDWKGPLDKDKKLLTPAGQAIMQGLIKGIDKTLPALRRQLTGVSSLIQNGITANPTVGLPKLTIPKSTHGSATGNVYVTVNAPVGSSPALIGKTIVEHIQAYTNVYGKAGMRKVV